MENELITMLKPVLDTLPQEDARRILAMVVHELHTQPLVTWCNAVTGFDANTGHPIIRDWKIMSPSPIDPDRTVWAMVETEDGIVVFTLCEVQSEDGSEGYAFFREVIREWKQLQGPISHGALVRTLERFMSETDDEDDETCSKCGQKLPVEEPADTTKTNGNGAAAHA